MHADQGCNQTCANQSMPKISARFYLQMTSMNDLQETKRGEGRGQQLAPFKRLIDMIRTNSKEFEADGRVLRLKQYMNSDARPPMIDMVLDALEVNTRVEALYIQNFELVRASQESHRSMTNYFVSTRTALRQRGFLSVVFRRVWRFNS